MYPGDPAGSAANIINCRCVEIARRAAGKMIDLEFYSNHNFYSYSTQPGAGLGKSEVTNGPED